MPINLWLKIIDVWKQPCLGQLIVLSISSVPRLHSALITFKLGQMDFNDIKSPHCSKKERERKKANKLIQDVQLGGQLHAD